MMINLEYYRTFLYVAIHKNVTRAAEALCLSQPAVSRTILNLENEMQCKLFLRTARGMVLTREGELLFSYISSAFKTIEMGESKTKRYSGFETGEIHIGAVESALYLLLIEKLKEFRKMYSKISININISSTKELYNTLINGALDIAFLSSPIRPIGDNINMYYIADIEDVFVCNSLAFPELASGTHKVEELLTYPIATLNKGTAGREFYDDWFYSLGLTHESVYNVPSSSTILSFIQNGLAIGFIPRGYLDVFSDRNINSTLSVISTDHPLPKRQIHLITNINYPMSNLCREFIRFVQE